MPNVGCEEFALEKGTPLKLMILENLKRGKWIDKFEMGCVTFDRLLCRFSLIYWLISVRDDVTVRVQR